MVRRKLNRRREWYDDFAGFFGVVDAVGGGWPAGPVHRELRGRRPRRGLRVEVEMIPACEKRLAGLHVSVLTDHFSHQLARGPDNFGIMVRVTDNLRIRLLSGGRCHLRYQQH